MSRLLPKSLVGRVIALLLLALITVQTINVSIFFDERSDEIRAAKVANLVSRTASIVRLLNGTPASLHPGILQAITTARMPFWLSEQSPIDKQSALTGKIRSDARFAELITDQTAAIRIVLERDRLNNSDVRGSGLRHGAPLPYSDQAMAIISIQHPQGQWLNAAQLALDPSHGWTWTLLMSLSFMALTVVIVIFLVRRITRPLALLTTATDRLGRGEKVASLPERGPEDMRRSIRAFNRMRKRLMRFVQDRTRMLAAISHDLRTPLTSLRLQAEFIEDPAMREKMIATVSEMQSITEATLAFARDDATREATRVMDLTALLDSLCQDLCDMGRDVTFSGIHRTPYPCRPIALKRAFRNLIENAVSYGGCAQVSQQTTENDLIVVIEDLGPGIPSAELDKVFEPFLRLEASRNLETGGIGLGMSIARSIVHAHGGEITLKNRKQRGLRVIIRLPRHRL